jgi:DNA-binding beta-propeller fold protein YncE
VSGQERREPGRGGIPPTSRTVTDTIEIGNVGRGLAASDDAVWVTSADDVSRIDFGSFTVTDMIPVGFLPAAVAVSDDTVLVTNFGDGPVSRIG